jgi:hypothetical protein
MMNRFCFGRGLRIALLVALAVAGFGFVVMSLWNWLMPALFGWRAIAFPEALGLLVLSRILFGGFHGRPGFGGHWRARMAERWEQMTPEEREKFRQGMRGRCGHFEPPSSGPTPSA